MISVGILAVLAGRLGTGAFLDGLRVLDVPSVLAALGIGALTTVVGAIRWCVVARHLGLALPLRTAIADYYQALFVNVTLPTGVLGDVQRAVGHGQRSGNVGRGVRAVVLERTGGQIVLFVLCALLLVAQPGVVAAVVGDFAVTAAVLGGFVVLVVGLVLWGLRSPRWRRTVGTTLADIRTGLLSRDTWPAVVGLSAIVLAGHLALFLVAARTAGVHAQVASLLTPIVLTLLASGLPVNIGGWGPRESVSVLAFEVAGLGAAQGLTVSVVYGVLTFAGALPGVVVLMARLRSRPKVQLEQRVVAEQETAGRRA